MSQKMLIDATQPEEIRVAVIDQKRLEEFDCETSTKKQVKGNVYLAKVVRIEPSLQAAFVDYGEQRHGFLSFQEIHPDYFQIPVDDRHKLIAQVKSAHEIESAQEENASTHEDHSGVNEEDIGVENADETHDSSDIIIEIDEIESAEDQESTDEELARKTLRLHQRYKIQEVIKRHQVLLVQVVKEERGNKGAALTTYVSLAGRYCVLMPNTLRGGGVSRKITDAQDRKRLKDILDSITLPDTMGAIIRTAGIKCTKAEIKKDVEYLQRLWDNIREDTLKSKAPALIHAEGNLIRRCLRDMYTKDIDQIIISGEEGYKAARELMRMLAPSHLKRIELYPPKDTPLFSHYGIEKQISDMYLPRIQLRSGGSLVMNQTEALVAIDVNSGRATRERHITDTALKTNLEAAEEISRQLRLRDMAGLIVIDFIDMDDAKHRYAVERKLKEAVRRDRARVQIGHISSFGLLEMSRQRLRPSLSEAHSMPCVHCQGSGWVRATESIALQILRHIESELSSSRAGSVTVFAPSEVAFYLLNSKRHYLGQIETHHNTTIFVHIQDGSLGMWRLEKTPRLERTSESEKTIESVVPDEDVAPSQETSDSSTASGGRKRRRSRRGNRNHHKGDLDVPAGDAAEATQEDPENNTQTLVLIPEVMPVVAEKTHPRRRRPLSHKHRHPKDDVQKDDTHHPSDSSVQRTHHRTVESFQEPVTVIEQEPQEDHPASKRKGWWQRWM